MMNLTSKHKGNVALAQALSYFGKRGYYLFLPVGDNGGDIDLVISGDGTNLQRVQCKYTSRPHNSTMRRYPDRSLWVVEMRQTRRREKDGHVYAELNYNENSFDLLFVVTPTGDYLVDWKSICQERGKAPSNIILGQQMEKYRVS
jgi:PD-(D/E)XK endonuclease